MKYLLDTNILSELRKPAGRRNAGLLLWMERVESADLYLSVLVVGEIRKGIERARVSDPTQGRALDLWLAQLQASYADRILPVSGAIADRWGRAQAGRNYSVIDSLMAATADVHDLQLVSRNVQNLAGWPAVHPPLNPFG